MYSKTSIQYTRLYAGPAHVNHIERPHACRAVPSAGGWAQAIAKIVIHFRAAATADCMQSAHSPAKSAAKIIDTIRKWMETDLRNSEPHRRQQGDTLWAVLRGKQFTSLMLEYSQCHCCKLVWTFASAVGVELALRTSVVCLLVVATWTQMTCGANVTRSDFVWLCAPELADN